MSQQLRSQADARERRAHRMSILSARRSVRARERRARRLRIMNARRFSRTRQAAHDEDTSRDDVSMVRDHFNRMRSRSRRTADSVVPLLGILDIDAPAALPSEPYTCAFAHLNSDGNHLCAHCGSRLWKEEVKAQYNCCSRGKYAVPPLQPIPEHIWDIFRSRRFHQSQRKYNGLFAFTALGAGGIERRTWTQPSPPSTLQMHGRAYHRIFDLQQTYSSLTQVSNASRFYIYDSEFTERAELLNLHASITSALRVHICDNVRWAQQYRSAIDRIFNSDTTSPMSRAEPAYIEFAEVNRARDGNVVGQAVSAPEIAAILYTSGQSPSSSRAVITYPRDCPDDLPRFLPLWSAAYESLQYPLLFLHGEAGWSRGHYTEEPPFRSRTMCRMNQNQVPFLMYCRQRLLSEPIFQLNSRIAQEWACDMYSRQEEHVLSFMEGDFLQRRVAPYRSVRESSTDSQPGKLLPATFHGSPIKRKTDTEDALAVVNRRGKPHLMVTMTCNPAWPEITANLERFQGASDRPDLCCRVFKIKLKDLMSDLKSGKVFGPYDYHMYVIEWQKRGLPHAHIVVRFAEGPSLTDIDSWVSAQLPDESICDGELRAKVLKFMVHKPCGAHNPNASCMETNKGSSRKHCNKYFPQPFRTSAVINERTGRAEYRRPDNGDRPTIRQKVNGRYVDVEIGNEWIVPYNAYLLMKYDCHICVDIVTILACVQYLFKYVHKGADMARARVRGAITNEIEQYRTTRYVSAAEACWRLLGFQVLSRHPAVTLIRAHLENEHNVTFPHDSSAAERNQRADNTISDLMLYFKRPLADVFTPLRILDYFESYTVARKKPRDQAPLSAPPGKWLDQCHNVVSKRQASNQHVCRIAFLDPSIGDLFYLRLLLHHTSARSFEQLRTTLVPNQSPVVHNTFHDAARARGIVSGDEEYFICMHEAVNFRIGRPLRNLFVTLILNGGPAPRLWHEFEDHLLQDLLGRMSRHEATLEALRQVDLRLQMHGKSNEQLNLPAVNHRETEFQRMASAFDRTAQTSFAQTQLPLLTTEQRTVYDTVLTSVQACQGSPLMIDAPAGTGKTFVERVIAATLRGQGKLVLIVASTGIAALQLPGGWTAHSMFKLPLDDMLTSGAVCQVRSESERAELLRRCNLIIWDELPMSHKYCVEALDLTMRDLLRVALPFGGKTILFSGDWRQIGPVVQYGSAADTVEASLISSHIWPLIQRYRLTISQRDRQDSSYADFVRAVGEDRVPYTRFPDGTEQIPLNNHHDDRDSAEYFTLNTTTDFDELLQFVYPNLREGEAQLQTRAILSSTNAAIDETNQHILDQRPGEEVTFYSSDTLISDEHSSSAFASPEHLNRMNVNNVPPHALRLKENTLAMLMRNLNFSEGLVNGQKGIVCGISPGARVIQVRLLTPGSDDLVLIPRITFHAQVGRNGIKFQRQQFPLRVAYALTINKSQGQTLTRVGIDLRSHVFAHGQLYVALSRAQGRVHVMVLLPPSSVLAGVPHTGNVVYAPFVEAATGQVHERQQSDPPSLHLPLTPLNPPHPPPPPLSPPRPTPRAWITHREEGDGSCGCRALARTILHNPERHHEVRADIVHYMSQHRDGDPFHILPGIGVEQIPTTEGNWLYVSYDDYLHIMSQPETFIGHTEILAAQLHYNVHIHVVNAGDPNPPLPPDYSPATHIYLRYSQAAHHYDSLQPPPPQPPQH